MRGEDVSWDPAGSKSFTRLVYVKFFIRFFQLYMTRLSAKNIGSTLIEMVRETVKFFSVFSVVLWVVGYAWYRKVFE